MEKRYLLVSGIVFGLISLLHFVRALYGWQFQIDMWSVPLWVSYCAVVGAGMLSACAFIQLKK